MQSISPKSRTNSRISKGCSFCFPDRQLAVTETRLAYSIRDKYPVSKDHILIIPKRHVGSIFDLSTNELHACLKLAKKERKRLQQADQAIQGFNIGVNDGKVAGQTIFHSHLHVIPRRDGDLPDPTGGIRNIFPGIGNYLTNAKSS